MGSSSTAVVEEQEHQLQDGTLETQMNKEGLVSSHSHGDVGTLSEEEEETRKEHVVISDQSVSKKMVEKESNFQEFKDDVDCVIPSPVLKDHSIASFFGTDLTCSLHLLGTKYNGLVKKWQEQTAENDKLWANVELISNKCVQECQPKYEALMNKYTQECSERKRLYNEIIELKGNIRVFCRCRPLSLEEIAKGVASVVEFDPHHDSELHVICSDNTRKQFKFDHVFNPKDDQEIVFAETLPVVKSVLDGYNVCIFAYGQTGTGKTFTMEGTSENRGVNYRALEELFKSSTERSSIDRYEFLVSMLEVYNEKIRDLLAENSNQPAKKLEIKQIDGTQDVPGLVEAQACGMDAVWEIFKTGKKNRSIGSTLANEQSSRSHCLVRVTVKGKNLINGQRSRSRMWLVDLAGSERVIRTEGDKERLKESQFINKSLSALGDVISALASKNPHIPYRNSKLTHLLQSSLGGDCKTLMFTQISPSSTDLAKTLCSLNFASRVRGIECGPARKQYDPAGSFKFKQMVEKLQREEKENAISNESLLLKALQEKVREQDNLIAEMNKAKIQIGNRDACKYCKRPRTPINVRKPLSQITNRLPPGGSQKISSRTMRTFENVHRSKQLTSFRQAGRPVGLSIPVQPKRSPTVAILPTEAERPQLPPNGQGIGGFNISLSSICNWKPLRLPGTAMRIVCKTPATRTMCKTPATRTMCKTRRQTVI